MSFSPKRDSVVVAVMGPTGTGKSSFIKRLTRNPEIIIGHGLTSGKCPLILEEQLADKAATIKVESYELYYEGVHFVLIDTPGFDDSSGIDTEIVHEILSWLKTSMGDGLLLSGLVYLHRISDPRITSTARSNMRLFRELCGDENLHNVVLGTTFWGSVDDATGRKRESQLLEDVKFWKPLADKGSRTFQLKEDRQVYLDVLSFIARQDQRFLIQAQEQMLSGQSLHETSAAKAMTLDLERFKQECKAKVAAERKQQQSLIEERARQQQEEHRREQQRIEEQHRLDLEKERKWEAGKEKKRREYEASIAWLERMRREGQEQELRRKRDLAERKLREQEEEAARLEKYSLHFCTSWDTKRWLCNTCFRRLDQRYGANSGQWCYHCCFCNNDTFYHCENCGDQCPQSNEHPSMKLRAVTQTLFRTLFG